MSIHHTTHKFSLTFVLCQLCINVLCYICQTFLIWVFRCSVKQTTCVVLQRLDRSQIVGWIVDMVWLRRYLTRKLLWHKMSCESTERLSQLISLRVPCSRKLRSLWWGLISRLTNCDSDALPNVQRHTTKHTPDEVQLFRLWHQCTPLK